LAPHKRAFRDYDGSNCNDNVQYDNTNLALITRMLTFLKQLSVFTVSTREIGAWPRHAISNKEANKLKLF